MDNDNQPRSPNLSAPLAASPKTQYSGDQMKLDDAAGLKDSPSRELGATTASYFQEQTTTTYKDPKSHSSSVSSASSLAPDSISGAMAPTQSQSGRQQVPFQISKYITTTPNIHKTGTTTTITAAEVSESRPASASFLVGNDKTNQHATNNSQSMLKETPAVIPQASIPTLSAAAVGEFQIPTQFLTLTAPQIDILTLVQLKETLFSATQYLQHADQVVKHYRSHVAQLKLQNQLLMIETHEASQRHEVENHLVKRELDRLRFDQIDRQNEAAAAAAAAAAVSTVESKQSPGSTLSTAPASNISSSVYPTAGNAKYVATVLSSPGSTDSDTYRRRLQRAKLRIRDSDKEIEQKNKEIAMLKKRVREGRLQREALEDALVNSSTPGRTNKLRQRRDNAKYHDDNDNYEDDNEDDEYEKSEIERATTPPSLEKKNKTSLLRTPQSATAIFNTRARASTADTTRDNGLDALGFLASQALQEQQNRKSTASESPNPVTTKDSFQGKTASHTGSISVNIPSLRFPPSGSTVSADASLASSPKKGFEKSGLRSPVAFKEKIATPTISVSRFPLTGAVAVATGPNAVPAALASAPAETLPIAPEKRRRESTGSTISNFSDSEDRSNNNPSSPKKQALESLVKDPETPPR
jgi:hypothetical protein